LSSVQRPSVPAGGDRESPWRYDSPVSAEDIERGWEVAHESERLVERMAERRGGLSLSDLTRIVKSKGERRSRRLRGAS
jgi:hypothetical protein